MNRNEFTEKYIGKVIDPDYLEGDWNFDNNSHECNWENISEVDYEEIRRSASVQLDKSNKVVDVGEMIGERLISEDATRCDFEEYDADDDFDLCDEDFECAIVTPVTFIVKAENEFSDPPTIYTEICIGLRKEVFDELQELAPIGSGSLQEMDQIGETEELEELYESIVDEAIQVFNERIQIGEFPSLEEVMSIEDVYEIIVIWPKELTKPHV